MGGEEVPTVRCVSESILRGDGEVMVAEVVVWSKVADRYWLIAVPRRRVEDLSNPINECMGRRIGARDVIVCVVVV